ncbi:MAG TPA: four helix bundle protein [Chitinophagaceae bacterium]|nr:four helix bundle protein [Chitinophagaceae bacterium]MCB9054317.1 four helix bundle protein [Chitinophagales bacterium]HPG12266.1 four helix bundle protein [Chitinophagaceae bacterium]HRX94849.1 four helix bundle protein [Chitinophagaceae bacterium]
MGYYKDLIVYKKAYELTMEIFDLSKKFPPEEKYSLTDQIRRSSRSVCANIAEAYRRRRYRDYFINKLNDAETENSETQVWLDFSKDCGYITSDQYKKLSESNDEIGKLIWYMINNPEKFRGKAQ